MRKLASIQRVWAIEPIDGADRIELAHVLGWQCVVNKGQFQPMDTAVYFEISVKELQAKMELASPQAIYKWQHGETIPSVDNLIILADVLRVSMDAIIVWKRVQH